MIFRNLRDSRTKKPIEVNVTEEMLPSIEEAARKGRKAGEELKGRFGKNSS